jgi:signal transduction histidine kinase
MGVLGLLVAQVVRRQMALARLKNDLVATVSHELKTPLSSMRVLVDTLLTAETLNEQTVREYLQLIAQENERLSRLIENFLTFSRIERKKYSFHFKPLPAADIIAAATAAVRQRFELPGCRFEVQVQDDLPDVIGDGEALVTALINLLDNAQKYSGEIKHIVLRVTAVNGHAVFSVQDNGPGVAPREMRRVFQPFFQANQHLSRNGGCGLGLSIVQSIVTAHHGTVSVSSRPGCGSTFSISIPAVQVPAKRREEAIA